MRLKPLTSALLLVLAVSTAQAEGWRRPPPGGHDGWRPSNGLRKPPPPPPPRHRDHERGDRDRLERRHDEPERRVRTLRPAKEMGLEAAVRRVRKQTDGRILSARTVERDGKIIHRIKVLTSDNKVRIIRVRPEDK